jgi:phosphate transport system substrate-binding protein
MIRHLKTAALAALLVGFTAACSPKEAAKPQEAFTIKIDGSSTVFPIAEAVAEDFQAAQGGKTAVTVGESGTGGGFKKFCNANTAVATHITNASRPISAKEMEECKAAGVQYIEIPVAFDALTVVVNPANPLNSIKIADLKKIWEPAAEGKVTNWKQANKSFPDLKLSLYAPGTASGTFDYFTEAVNGKSKAQRTDVTPSEDDNVLVQGVSSDPGGIAYFGLAYYEQNKTKVKALSVDAGKGAIAPSKETVENASYAPLSRPIFIYVNAAAAKNPKVAALVDFWLTNGKKYAEQVGYVGLPVAAYETGAARVKTSQIGTAFGGKNDVGANIVEVLARPLVVDAPAAPAEPAK